MNSIIFICPYFGKLPESTMPLWLQSCEKNPDIDWWIMTDDETKYKYPQNVKAVYMTFEKFIEKIEQRFKRRMNLKAPYKLCDYKPTYGYIFEDDIKNYDFWGHCDLGDTIFGHLRFFLTDDILNKNDKILFLGHMTIYRNTREVNRRFLLKTKSEVDIWNILSNKENMAFDEINPYSINTIYKENNFSLVRLDGMYADLAPNYFRFIKSSYDESFIRSEYNTLRRVFFWEDGRLYECFEEDGYIRQKEIGYVHFQKRNMKNMTTNAEKGFCIVPNKFIDYEGGISRKFIKKHSRGRVLYLPFFVNKKNALCYKLRHIDGGIMK